MPCQVPHNTFSVPRPSPLRSRPNGRFRQPNVSSAEYCRPSPLAAIASSSRRFFLAYQPYQMPRTRTAMIPTTMRAAPMAPSIPFEGSSLQRGALGDPVAPDDLERLEVLDAATPADCALDA